MAGHYFVQYTDASIINQFCLPKNSFRSIDIGIRHMESEFLLETVQNLFCFPIFFVLEHTLSNRFENNLLEKKAQYIDDTLIVKAEDFETLVALCQAATELTANGLSVFIFKGDGLTERDCLVSRTGNGLIEFPNLDLHLLESFMEINEVGLTLFTKSKKFFTPVKLAQYIPSKYEMDRENSDIV